MVHLSSMDGCHGWLVQPCTAGRASSGTPIQSVSFAEMKHRNAARSAEKPAHAADLDPTAAVPLRLGLIAVLLRSLASGQTFRPP
jgi:hypothetical protein